MRRLRNFRNGQSTGGGWDLVAPLPRKKLEVDRRHELARRFVKPMWIYYHQWHGFQINRASWCCPVEVVRWSEIAQIFSVFLSKTELLELYSFEFEQKVFVSFCLLCEWVISDSHSAVAWLPAICPWHYMWVDLTKYLFVLGRTARTLCFWPPINDQSPL